MAYFKIDGIDFSNIVNSLEVSSAHNYNAQQNASGDTVVDYINTKRELAVGIIPLTSEQLKPFYNAIERFNVVISFRNPKTDALDEMNCIIPENSVDYYTIQANNVRYNQLNIKCIEL